MRKQFPFEVFPCTFI